MTPQETYIDDIPSDFSDALTLDDKEYEEYLEKLKAEVSLVDAVITDYQKNNSTDKVCLYCGEKMQMEKHNSFYEVKCPKGCISETFRGI